MSDTLENLPKFSSNLLDSINSINIKSDFSKYVDATINVGRFITHAAVAVLTGNIAGLVNDIVDLVNATQHCKKQCKRLGMLVSVTSAATIDLIRLHEKKLVNESLAPALKNFHTVLDTAKNIIKQHVKSKYGWKIFFAKQFESEFNDVEQDLQMAIMLLGLATTCQIYMQAIQQSANLTLTLDATDKAAFDYQVQKCNENIKEISRIESSEISIDESLSIIEDLKITVTDISATPLINAPNIFYASYQNQQVILEVFDISATLSKKIDKVQLANLIQFAKVTLILQRLKDVPDIIHLYGITVTQSGKLAMVLEHIGEDTLADAIQEHRFHGNWVKIREIAQQIANTLAFIHDANIYHKSLSPKHIMLDKDGNAKLTHFAASRMATDGTCESLLPIENENDWYAAPEVRRSETFTDKCDVFSFGVILWNLIIEKPPFEGMTQTQRDCLSHLSLPDSLEVLVPMQLSLIIENCTRQSPSKRSPASDISQMLNKSHLPITSTEKTLPSSSVKLPHHGTILEETLRNLSLPDITEITQEKETLRNLPLPEITEIIQKTTPDTTPNIPKVNIEALLTDANALWKLHSYISAFNLYLKCHPHHPFATFRIGECYWYSSKTKVFPENSVDDPKKLAMEYFELAVEKENPEALDFVGYLYIKGDEDVNIKKDWKRAVELLKKAVNRECFYAGYHLGYILALGGNEIQKDILEAERLICWAATGGVKEAVSMAKKQGWKY